MKMLVTGAAGFIGSHVANSLMDDGHEVIGLDNFNDYYSVQLKRDRHARLLARKAYTGTEGDLCDATLVRSLFDRHRFEVVCHLAAQPGVRYSLERPDVYQKSNLEGFLNILEACRHAGTRRLVYASSSSVYGGNTKLPFSESDPVDRPISLYAATKKANELMAYTYTHLFGLQTVGLRFFTVYGPWSRPDMATWLFAAAMLKGQPIKVFNHGNMRRDFTFVDDIVQGIKASLFETRLNPYEVFNLGNHNAENLKDMIRTLGAALGVEPKMQFMPMQPGDVEATYADITLAKAKLGFEPRVGIDEGLPIFAAWFKNYHQGAGS